TAVVAVTPAGSSYLPSPNGGLVRISGTLRSSVSTVESVTESGTVHTRGWLTPYSSMLTLALATDDADWSAPKGPADNRRRANGAFSPFRAVRMATRNRPVPQYGSPYPGP